MSSIVAVVLDTLKGAKGSHKLAPGWSITRSAFISGLNASGTATTGKLLSDAEAALVSVVGLRGTPCPDILVPTYLDDFAFEAVAATVVEATITYKGYPLPKISFDGALDNVETNLDRFGNTILVYYQFANDYPDQRYRGRYIPQASMVQWSKTEAVAMVDFLITNGVSAPTNTTAYIPGFASGSYSATDFASIMAFYSGKVNSQTYTIGQIVGAPRTWKAKFRASSNDGGFTYDAQMTFQYRSEGWDKVVAFLAPDTGKPPNDIVAGVGYYQPEVDDEVQFPDFNFSVN